MATKCQCVEICEWGIKLWFLAIWASIITPRLPRHHHITKNVLLQRISRIHCTVRTRVAAMLLLKQGCIPVGCVPPACSPYPSMHCMGGVCVYRSLHWTGGVYPSMHWAGGCLPRVGCLPRGVSAQCGCLPRGDLSRGVSASGLGVADTPPVNRMTDRCKNITLPQLRCGW